MRYSYSDGVLLPMKEDNINELCSLIEMCKEKDITPILITTPYQSCYRDGFAKPVLDAHYAKTDEICKKYGVEYWDYSRIEKIVDNESYFSDVDHLNSEGATAFTQIVTDRLKEEKIIN